MKLIYYIYIALITFLCSCSLTEVLDQEPPHALPSDHAIIDLPTAENALIGAYAQLPEAHIEFMGAYMTGLLRASSTGSGFVTNEIATNHSTVTSYWSRLYRVVSAANGLLQQLPDVQTENVQRKEEILATAHFLRAYANFELLRYFARYDDYGHQDGIIIRTELVQLSNYEKARSTVQESYDFIEQDLLEAVEKVPTSSPRHFVNKSTVHALMSRLYLFRAYARQDNKADLQLAISFADKVLESNVNALENSFEQIFKKGLNSPELIWGRFPDKTIKMKYNNYLVSPSPFVMYGPKLDSMLNEDPRKNHIIGANPTYRTKAITKYYVNNQEIDETLYLIRVPELHLIKAESLWRMKSDLQNCKNALNVLLKRIGKESLATNRDEFGRELFHNWAIELFLENGHEWFASHRFDQIESLQNLTDKKRYIFPIPLKETDLNTLAGQNDGY